MGRPTLAEVIRQAIESRIADVHTCLPGRVKTYDPATQRADVEIVVRSAVEASDGSTVHEELPVIPNVPVAWLRGGGFSLQFPLAPGDHVWLMFSETALGFWRESGQVSDPGDLAKHSLSYPVALPCIAPDTAPLPALSANESAVDVPNGTTLRVGGPTANFVALAHLVLAELNKIRTAFNGHSHSVSGLAAPSGGGTITGSLGGAPNMPAISPVAATKLKAE